MNSNNNNNKRFENTKNEINLQVIDEDHLFVSKNSNQINTNNEDVEIEQVKKERDEWDSKLEYMLSVIGYVVDLGNCVRFPYIAYKNGGGAFLIPYFTFLFLVGMPMMYLEMAVGQYFRVGNIALWGKVNVYMKGIGWGSLLVVCYITLYYATIIAYSVYYLIVSFAYVMPWSTCNNEWNTNRCLPLANQSKSGNETVWNSPADEYYRFKVLAIQHSTGLIQFN
jgi:solute carrier family 6 (neurotransmitter transporter, serotonin) member 4